MMPEQQDLIFKNVEYTAFHNTAEDAAEIEIKYQGRTASFFLEYNESFSIDILSQMLSDAVEDVLTKKFANQMNPVLTATSYLLFIFGESFESELYLFFIFGGRNETTI